MSSTRLMVDRFGLFRIRRFKSEKEIQIESDYPVLEELRTLVGDHVLVDLVLKFDLKSMKQNADEFGFDIPSTISKTPIHHVTYYLERSRLDALLAFVHYGSVVPSLSVSVAHVEGLDKKRFAQEVQWLSANPLLGAEFAELPRLGMDEDDDVSTPHAADPLSTVLTHANAIVGSYFRRYTKINETTYLRACDEYWKASLKQNPQLDISARFSWAKEFAHVLSLAGRAQESDPNSAVIVSANMLYASFGKDILGIQKDLGTFASLMERREGLLLAMDCLPDPMRYLPERGDHVMKKFGHEWLDRLVFDKGQPNEELELKLFSLLSSLDHEIDLMFGAVVRKRFVFGKKSA